MIPSPSQTIPGRSRTLLDLVLVTLLLAAGIHLWLGSSREPGQRAVLRVEGKKFAWWSLEGDRQTDTVHTPIGEYAIAHGEGTVQILAAPCINRLCIHQGKVRHSGDRLLCLPGRLVLSIEGAGEDGFDAIQ